MEDPTARVEECQSKVGKGVNLAMGAGHDDNVFALCVKRGNLN